MQINFICTDIFEEIRCNHFSWTAHYSSASFPVRHLLWITLAAHTFSSINPNSLLHQKLAPLNYWASSFLSSSFLSFCFLLFSFSSQCTRETEIKREREMRAEGEKNTERLGRPVRENSSNPGETGDPTFRWFMVGDVRDFRWTRGTARSIEIERTRVRPNEPRPTSVGQHQWPTGSPIFGRSTAGWQHCPADQRCDSGRSQWRFPETQFRFPAKSETISDGFLGNSLGNLL